MSDELANIQRLEALRADQRHIRTCALQLAGEYLQLADQKLIEQQLNKLDDELDESMQVDSALYLAYEALCEAIAHEVLRIGQELCQQAQESEQRHDPI
ncbi:MAG: hypothetical protein JO202_02885 [Ktedonobacteraceae bacterium]|nr:hypothetical protein [Ktedonobacteraceae bacterium]